MVIVIVEVALSATLSSPPDSFLSPPLSRSCPRGHKPARDTPSPHPFFSRAFRGKSIRLSCDGQEIREYGDGVTDIGIMWEEARDEGKDAFIVSANYQCGGDDIAVFDLRGFSLQGIKTKLPGQDWTEYMEAEEAVRLFKQFWGWSEE